MNHRHSAALWHIMGNSAVMKAEGPVPEWFQKGIEAALFAPTAMNQQKFLFTLKENAVAARAGTDFYTKIDLEIAKYHFEIDAGRENFHWEPNFTLQNYLPTFLIPRHRFFHSIFFHPSLTHPVQFPARFLPSCQIRCHRTLRTEQLSFR